MAATKSPIIFIGTGEHINDFEPFKVKSFVSKLLDLGDIDGFCDQMKETRMSECTLRLGNCITLREIYEEFQYMSQIGSVNQILVI